MTSNHLPLHFPCQGVDSQVMQAISVVPEEKVIFGLNATAISHLTLNKIRKMYSKVDNKAIAKQVCCPPSHQSLGTLLPCVAQLMHLEHKETQRRMRNTMMQIIIVRIIIMHIKITFNNNFSSLACHPMRMQPPSVWCTTLPAT